jgi:ketosteroid isomerase-like protein
MATIRELDDQMNQAIRAGKAMELFETLYADDCEMQENSEAPRVGKAACRDYEVKFFSMLEAFHGASLERVAVDGDVSYAEWTLDFTLKGMPRMKYTQVTQRIWKDGKIWRERFFYSR